MGAIYASADITLIAAAGEDSNYGLPGASRKSESGIEYIGSDTFLEGMRYKAIDSSTWAQRGWTLQEGYMSRRRLCFTEREIRLFCNMAVYPVLEEKLLIKRPAYLGETRASLEPRSSTFDILEQYTERKLTYDSDALNAIVGVLNSLSQSPQRSDRFKTIWGVPFDQGRSLVLHWYHYFPTSRRQGFPSWSPLGWRGQIYFERAYGSPPIFHRAIEADVHEHNRLDLCNIKIWMGEGYGSLPPLRVGEWNQETFLTPQSQYLEITALTNRLQWAHLKLDEDNPSYSRGGRYLVLPSNSVSDLYFGVLMDDADFDHAQENSAMCALLPLENSLGPICLVLKSHAGFYERIGYMWMGNAIKGPKYVHSEHGKDFWHLNSTDFERICIDKYSSVDELYWYKDQDWYKDAEMQTFLLG